MISLVFRQNVIKGLDVYFNLNFSYFLTQKKTIVSVIYVPVLKNNVITFLDFCTSFLF